MSDRGSRPSAPQYRVLVAHNYYQQPGGEDQVFANVMESNPGPLPSDAVKRIFERIIDEMRVVQKLKMEKGT